MSITEGSPDINLFKAAGKLKVLKMTFKFHYHVKAWTLMSQPSVGNTVLGKTI